MRFFINSLIVTAVLWLFYTYVLVPHVFPPREEAPEEIRASDSVIFNSLSEISRRNTEPRTQPIRFLVVHGTANDSSYATAWWHHIYLDTTSREVSWHASIDSLGIIEHFPDSLKTYAASSREMNAQCLNVEMCQPGGEISLVTILNTARYIRRKKKEYPNIKVIFHDEVPLYVKDAKLHGKICPAKLHKADRAYLRDVK